MAVRPRDSMVGFGSDGKVWATNGSRANEASGALNRDIHGVFLGKSGWIQWRKPSSDEVANGAVLAVDDRVQGEEFGHYDFPRKTGRETARPGSLKISVNKIASDASGKLPSSRLYSDSTIISPPAAFRDAGADTEIRKPNISLVTIENRNPKSFDFKVPTQRDSFEGNSKGESYHEERLRPCETKKLGEFNISSGYLHGYKIPFCKKERGASCYLRRTFDQGNINTEGGDTDEKNYALRFTIGHEGEFKQWPKAIINFRNATTKTSPSLPSNKLFQSSSSPPSPSTSSKSSNSFSSPSPSPTPSRRSTEQKKVNERNSFDGDLYREETDEVLRIKPSRSCQLTSEGNKYFESETSTPLFDGSFQNLPQTSLEIENFLNSGSWNEVSGDGKDDTREFLKEAAKEIQIVADYLSRNRSRAAARNLLNQRCKNEAEDGTWNKKSGFTTTTPKPRYVVRYMGTGEKWGDKKSNFNSSWAMSCSDHSDSDECEYEYFNDGYSSEWTAESSPFSRSKKTLIQSRIKGDDVKSLRKQALDKKKINLFSFLSPAEFENSSKRAWESVKYARVKSDVFHADNDLEPAVNAIASKSRSNIYDREKVNADKREHSPAGNGRRLEDEHFANEYLFSATPLTGPLGEKKRRLKKMSMRENSLTRENTCKVSADNLREKDLKADQRHLNQFETLEIGNSSSSDARRRSSSLPSYFRSSHFGNRKKASALRNFERTSFDNEAFDIEARVTSRDSCASIQRLMAPYKLRNATRDKDKENERHRRMSSIKSMFLPGQEINSSKFPEKALDKFRKIVLTKLKGKDVKSSGIITANYGGEKVDGVTKDTKYFDSKKFQNGDLMNGKFRMLHVLAKEWNGKEVGWAKETNRTGRSSENLNLEQENVLNVNFKRDASKFQRNADSVDDDNRKGRFKRKHWNRGLSDPEIRDPCDKDFYDEKVKNLNFIGDPGIQRSNAVRKSCSFDFSLISPNSSQSRNFAESMKANGLGRSSSDPGEVHKLGTSEPFLDSTFCGSKSGTQVLSDGEINYGCENTVNSNGRGIKLKRSNAFNARHHNWFAEALWDHVASERDELPFKAGDVIKVFDAADGFWWWGTLKGKVGYFPSTCVRLMVNADVENSVRATALQEKYSNCRGKQRSVPELTKDGIRSNIIRELLNTEREFVKGLSKVVEGYVKKCKKRSDMFSPSQINSIFSNLENLLSFHTEFLRDLEEKIDMEFPHKSCIGNVFLLHKTRFQIYSEYCNSHPLAMATLQDLYKKNNYKEFFEGCRTAGDFQEIPLDGYLLTPVQRICKYPLQLTELFKYTDPGHLDHEKVREALETMKKVATLINERKRKMEGLEKLVEWQCRVEGWEGPHIADVSSQLIYQCEVVKVNADVSANNLTLFLFDHQLVYCKKDMIKRNIYAYKGRISLDSASILVLPDGKNQEIGSTIKHGIQVLERNRERCVVFCCRSEKEKTKLLEMLSQERKIVAQNRKAGLELSPASRELVKLSAKAKSADLKPKRKMFK